MIPGRVRWGWHDLRTHPKTNGGAREPCPCAVGPDTFCPLFRALEKLLIMCFIIHILGLRKSQGCREKSLLTIGS